MGKCEAIPGKQPSCPAAKRTDVNPGMYTGENEKMSNHGVLRATGRATFNEVIGKEGSTRTPKTNNGSSSSANANYDCRRHRSLYLARVTINTGGVRDRTGVNISRAVALIIIIIPGTINAIIIINNKAPSRGRREQQPCVDKWTPGGRPPRGKGCGPTGLALPKAQDFLGWSAPAMAASSNGRAEFPRLVKIPRTNP
uniref:Uncharacterized protein n=1 Tax=Anopheles atroparvus TaxID=41427 RepID=A0A182IZW5_ANOAO